ncbi:metallophosphoesterase family protein [Mesobacterium sp. TK19101]|uniref:Metallophosphoesterase family protein n=1 Tax=Mesobacterium hydrothermale TaxID=3111907 RepID=A0ABU6HJ44_9RHOB|nr:metallophosphoesterase family protein [Mesobacterium sp. TK19101]MEC3861155.1 metallophosphoesterase family protein [Mesobacterium sp. TK19101]
MKIADLGRLDGPLIVFGGQYANLQALQALRDVALQLGLPPSQCLCTGDVVAYCADAAATVAEIRDWAVPVVAGNCEIQLAEGADTCGCGFGEGTVCDRLSANWYAAALAACEPEVRAWMGTCPDLAVFEHAGRRCAMFHGGVTDVARFLWPVSDDADFAEEIAAVQAVAGPVDRVFVGHSGIAFQRRVRGVDWVNAGVIGMPPHDGARATRYCTVAADGAVAVARLDYDAEAAALAMRAAGLVQGYDRALLSGWWPSEEALPVGMRRGTATGA